MKSPHNNMCIFLSMEMVRETKWAHLNKPITIWNFPELSFPRPRNRAHDVVKTNPQRGRNGLLRVFSSIECELEHKRRWVLLPCFVSHCLEVSFVDASVALSLARMSSAAMFLQTILLQHRDQNWRDCCRWTIFLASFLPPYSSCFKCPMGKLPPSPTQARLPGSATSSVSSKSEKVLRPKKRNDAMICWTKCDWVSCSLIILQSFRRLGTASHSLLFW